ncbi:hypothetical protein BD413DRAFT_39899 [Trametes elegans]|nr:hypothetical protein BD413DRAFT_39899 [Trametes elegans]
MDFAPQRLLFHADYSSSTEVCENILIFCSKNPGSWEVSAWIWQSYVVLRACSLACRDWLPRSRLKLYSIVILTDSSRFDNFADTVVTNPFLADIILELRVRSHHKYILITSIELTTVLRSVRSLVFDTRLLLYPPRFNELVGRFPIRTLSIWDLSIFPSWSALFALVSLMTSCAA